MNLIKAAAPAALALALTGPALAGDMVLSGTGIVHAAPDMATISTGVVTQAPTAREALDANSAAMADLIAVLREAGLESRDIQTADFNVSPVPTTLLRFVTMALVATGADINKMRPRWRKVRLLKSMSM